MTPSEYKELISQDTINIGKDLEDLADEYDGNLLNYFWGLTPSESRTFNKMIKEAYKSNV